MRKVNASTFINNFQGRVGVPVLMYALGVPGFFVVLIWLFFFRGK